MFRLFIFKRAASVKPVKEQGLDGNLGLTIVNYEQQPPLAAVTDARVMKLPGFETDMKAVLVAYRCGWLRTPDRQD